MSLTNQIGIDSLKIKGPKALGEARLSWDGLPYGPMLWCVILRPSQFVAGAGDDISNYFYCLKQHKSPRERSAFGRSIRGEDVLDYGGLAGKRYRLCLGVVVLGGHNFVDIAQSVHRSMLQGRGCLHPDEELVYGSPFPCGEHFEGVYIETIASLV